MGHCEQYMCQFAHALLTSIRRSFSSKSLTDFYGPAILEQALVPMFFLPLNYKSFMNNPTVKFYLWAIPCRGVPVEKYSRWELTLLWWGIGQHIGRV